MMVQLHCAISKLIKKIFEERFEKQKKKDNQIWQQAVNTFSFWKKHMKAEIVLGNSDGHCRGLSVIYDSLL